MVWALYVALVVIIIALVSFWLVALTPDKHYCHYGNCDKCPYSSGCPYGYYR